MIYINLVALIGFYVFWLYFLQIYNAALRYIPTPANRSLVYFMDADLLMVDSSVVDRALRAVRPGKTVMFPSIQWTKGKVDDSTTVLERLINGTIWEKKFSNRWARSKGMVAFYLFDNPLGYWYVLVVYLDLSSIVQCTFLIEFRGSYLFKEVWGDEDMEHFYQYKALEGKQELNVLWPDERYLLHIDHKHAHNWKKSVDGVS